MKLKALLFTLLLSKPNEAATHSSGINTWGLAEQKHRRLPHPHPHHSSSGNGGTSDYYGCLDLNSTEQAEVWPDGPSCDYDSDSGNSGNSTSSSGGTDGNSGTGGDSGGGDGGDDMVDGGGDGDGDGDDTVTQYEVVDDDMSSTNPYDDFVITKCNTYESLWRWDLHMSCGSDSSNLDNCNCTFAEELFDKGLLVCQDRERCPRNCPICSTCLSVLGCPETSGPSNRLATSTLIYIVVGAVILLIVALAVFHSRRRRQQQQHELKQQLITEDDYGVGDTESEAEGRFEPPTTGTRNAAPVIGGTMAGGTWKAAKETGSEADTDDCTQSVEAAAPPLEQPSSAPFVAPSSAAIVTVRSEEEDVGPEDEKEETEILGLDQDETLESAGSDENVVSENPHEVANVGKVREAFLESLEATDNSSYQDLDERNASPSSETEANADLEVVTNEPESLPVQSNDLENGDELISGQNHTLANNGGADHSVEESSVLAGTVDENSAGVGDEN